MKPEHKLIAEVLKKNIVIIAIGCPTIRIKVIKDIAKILAEEKRALPNCKCESCERKVKQIESDFLKICGADEK